MTRRCVGAMTKYERVMAAIEHKPVDKVPAFCLGADFEFYHDFMHEVGFKKSDFEQYLKDGIVDTPPINHALAVELGFDCDWYTHTSRLHYDPELNSLVDTWGSKQKVVVRDSGIPHMWYTGPFLTSKRKILEWWDQGRPSGYSDILLRKVKKQMKTLLKPKYDEHVMFLGLSGPYECISMAIGLGRLAKYCRKDPDFVDEILRRNLEVQLDGLKNLCKVGPPVIMCGDDHGFVNGLQMPVKHWRRFIKPALQEYVDLVHSYGIKFIIHSCGNIGEIFPDFVEMGIDGVESLQPTINDLPMLKRKYGDDLTLLGTIDDTHLLVEENPAMVRKIVNAQIKTLGKDSGFLPGATNFLLNQKVENIQEMVATIHEFDAGTLF